MTDLAVGGSRLGESGGEDVSMPRNTNNECDNSTNNNQHCNDDTNNNNNDDTTNNDNNDDTNNDNDDNDNDYADTNNGDNSHDISTHVANHTPNTTSTNGMCIADGAVTSTGQRGAKRSRSASPPHDGAQSVAERRVSRQASQLDEFMEDGVDDGSTMAMDGVWASHVQVLQTAAWLERPVALLRPDGLQRSFVGNVCSILHADTSLTLRFDDALAQRPCFVAGAAYVIEPAVVAAQQQRKRRRRDTERVPVTLVYSPWPGHYDAACDTVTQVAHVRALHNDQWGELLQRVLALHDFPLDAGERLCCGC